MATTMSKSTPGMDLTDLRAAIRQFNDNGQIGQDPLAQRYVARRQSWSLFSGGLRDDEMEVLRDYLFPYQKLPASPGDEPVIIHNLINGEWVKADQYVTLNALWDNRVPVQRVADSQQVDVEKVIASAYDFWASLEWADEVVTYRKWVVNNVSRLLEYFYEEVMAEIRHLIPKTRLEADKDFWEAKRAADHIGGNVDKAMTGEMIPYMMSGHSYWKNPYLPAGVSAVITPMNFIYGIPMIQLVGAYLSGSPLIFKGHPYGAICNTVMSRMFLAAGADPRSFHKLEGFGKGISGLATDKRVAVVSLTGSEHTAKKIAEGRGVRTLKFEGGGCNWSWVDDGYSDDDLRKIAERLTYSKLGFSSHKCTTLHGVAAKKPVLDKLIQFLNEEMDRWELKDPHTTADTKVIGPNMVHKAQTVTNIQEAARKAGQIIRREGGKVSGNDYADHAEVIQPVIIELTDPKVEITCDWDGEQKTFSPATTEFFMPILCAMAMDGFDDFLKFSLLTNSHDLACSIWSRDDKKLAKARRIIGGMLKENDGTDSALEWEEFGASGIGDSGNMGVGDAAATLSIYSRRQKGRHCVF